jgi:hypothetical protein
MIREVDALLAPLSDEEKERFWLAVNAELDERLDDEQPELIKRAYAYGRGEIVNREDIWKGLEPPDPTDFAKKLKEL